MNKYLIAIFSILIFVVSCSKNDPRERAKKIVTEWTGKTLIIPENIDTYFMNRDTIVGASKAPYRIFVYTDSTGCTSCKLKLQTWKHYMHEADSLLNGKLDFLFYFQPKNERELQFLFKRDKFEVPIHMDKEALILKQNSLPGEMEYQCFLLDSNNKIISIGNPTLNPKIWELYKQIITKDYSDKSKTNTTQIEIENSHLIVDNLKVGTAQKLSFKIKNTGNSPLIINHIDASCGCTVPSWDKKPISPNEEAEIWVEVKPDNKGYFRKSLILFANIEGKTKSLTISGEASE